MERLIDSNCHVIAASHERERYPLDGFGVSVRADQSAPLTVDELTKLMDAAGITKGLLFSSRFHGFDNSYCVDSASRYPERFATVANVNIFDPGAADQVRYWVDTRGMHGIRLWGGGEGVADWVDDEAFTQVWRTLVELNVPSNAQKTFPPTLGKTRRLLARFPGLKLTINNLAQLEVSEGPRAEGARALCALAEFPNVYVNLSASFFRRVADDVLGARGIFDALLTSFGSRRLMWSAFYPNDRSTSMAESVRDVEAGVAGLSADERSWILGGATEALYPQLRDVGGDSRDPR